MQDGLISKTEFVNHFDSKLASAAHEFRSIISQFTAVAQECRKSKQQAAQRAKRATSPQVQRPSTDKAASREAEEDSQKQQVPE